jgi:hypothetical protein
VRFLFRDSLGILHRNSLKVSAPGPSILQPMQQIAERSGVAGDAQRAPTFPPEWESASSPASSSFAGLLAAITAPALAPGVSTDGSLPRGWKPMPAWNDDDLADDVATLSYERALRTHARYKPAGTGDRALTQVPDSERCQTCGALQAGSASAADAATMPAMPGWCEDSELRSAHGLSPMPDGNRKCASVTIRLSKAECEQLRRRSAEAGLTVSAYLRSCTFEAEALRAQVKETLAELRKTSPTEKRSTQTLVRRSWFEWLFRLIPHWHMGQRVARA